MLATYKKDAVWSRCHTFHTACSAGSLLPERTSLSNCLVLPHLSPSHHHIFITEVSCFCLTSIYTLLVSHISLSHHHIGLSEVSNISLSHHHTHLTEVSHTSSHQHKHFTIVTAHYVGPKALPPPSPSLQSNTDS